jgi:translin
VDLNQIAETIRVELDAKTAARDLSLNASRSTIRSCGNAIRAMHRYEFDVAQELLAEAQSHLDSSRSSLADHSDVRHAGFIHDAEKEFAEARITFALVNGKPLPAPDEVGVPPQAYLKGMAESIGELRRHLLDLLRKGEMKRCEELLGSMDDIYHVLVTMDYPDGITFGLRRLTDVARSIIERTRGDFTISTVQSSLRSALEQHEQRLDKK